MRHVTNFNNSAKGRHTCTGGGTFRIRQGGSTVPTTVKIGQKPKP